ncbi:hypothetical protein R1flu_025918 [Riccia fluitans]|uniref:Uncharacterized protein n=1 Tax=Riccia fluitans TaxID=41844 RepID=A0ABD1XZ46_9MARC
MHTSRFELDVAEQLDVAGRNHAHDTPQVRFMPSQSGSSDARKGILVTVNSSREQWPGCYSRRLGSFSPPDGYSHDSTKGIHSSFSQMVRMICEEYLMQ